MNMVRRFYAEDDPFHELFQVWNALSSFLFFMNRIDNAFLNPNSRDSDLSSFLGLPMLRIADLSDLQTKMNVTCKPTVTEGKWYRMESILAALLIRRSVECHSNSDNSNVFVEAFTPAPTVVEGGQVEAEGKQKQGNQLSSSVFVIALLCVVVVILAIALVVALVKRNGGNVRGEAFPNNRIVVPSHRAQTQYGTF